MAQSEIHKADSDLTVNQLILLIEIEKNPNLQQIDLAELIFKDVASVTRMTDLLFKKGHLRRKVNPKYRRTKTLTLTKTPKEVLKKLMPVITTYRETAIKGFSSKDRKSISNLLDRLSNNCKIT